MIYLLLSILCGSMVSLVMRISEGRIGSKTGMVAMNYLTCLLVAGSFMGFGNVMPEHPLAGLKSVPIRAFEDEQFIMPLEGYDFEVRQVLDSVVYTAPAEPAD